VSALLSPVALGELELANRVAVAPMSRVSTAGDGVPTGNMVAYYEAFARGGFGLIVTEGTYIDHAHSQAYANQPAIVTGAQVRAWARVVDAVHAAGGRIVLQLMHAGALVQHTDAAIAPSAVQPLGRKLHGYGGVGPYAFPRAMTGGEIAGVVEAFAASAARARDAGFDGVEVHAANGYLLDQFLTPYTNVRDDAYGADGGLIVAEVLEAITALPAGVRLSQVKVNDLAYRWSGPEQARALFASVARGRPAYVHVASEGASWEDTSVLAPGVTTTGLARRVFGVPVVANGGMHDPALATRLVEAGETDLVSLGHGALANPDWPRRLAAGEPFEPFDPGLLQPEVTIENSLRRRAHTLLDQGHVADRAAVG
jgi:2,4-dienoyl-CoA reductase-like NADH-dependent reductase (Old Yellow Enzyme family)